MNPQRLLRQPAHFIPRNPKIIRNQRGRISRQPFRNRNLLERRAIEQRKKLRRLASDLFHVVPKSLLDKSHLPRPKFFRSRSSVRAKYRDPCSAADVVLPFVRIG